MTTPPLDLFEQLRRGEPGEAPTPAAPAAPATIDRRWLPAFEEENGRRMDGLERRLDDGMAAMLPGDLG